MPVGTKVDDLYKDLLQKGYAQKDAAKIAQARTGLSLVTGRPPRNKPLKRAYHGQYGSR